MTEKKFITLIEVGSPTVFDTKPMEVDYNLIAAITNESGPFLPGDNCNATCVRFSAGGHVFVREKADEIKARGDRACQTQ